MTDWYHQAKLFASDLNHSSGVFAAEPHENGVYVWLTNSGFSFGYSPNEVDDPSDPDNIGGNIRAFYDFRVMDCFTMKTLPECHRHYRDSAAIFLNLVFDEHLVESRDIDAPSATTVFNMMNHD